MSRLGITGGGLGLGHGGVPLTGGGGALVMAGPYDTAAAGAGNWGSTSVSARDFVLIGQLYRIRQNGTIRRVRLYCASTADVTGFYLMVWRADGANYDLVGIGNNIAGQLVTGQIATIDLATPVVVQEGDFYGGRMEWSTPHLSFFARTSQTNAVMYYVNGQATSSDYNWGGQTVASGSAMPIELYMDAPDVVFIGDSIVMGATAHTSYLSAVALESAPATTIAYQLSALTGWSYQNMGIAQQATTAIAARFAADVIALKPRFVVIDGGVNDIAGGGTKATYLANWTSMLAAAQADTNIVRVFALKILPWSNGTNVQMQARDDWNASLVTLAANYSKVTVVDGDSYVGEFRVGGDAGNLWNIQAAFAAGDGVHFNQAGYGQIAQAIFDSL